MIELFEQRVTITHCEIGLSSVYCYQNFRGDTENGYSTGHYAAVGGIVGYTNGGRSF